MKYGIVFCLFIICGLPALGQFDSTYAAQPEFQLPYGKRKLIIGPYMTVVKFRDFSAKMAIGMDAEYMMGKQVGLGAVLGAGYNYAEFSASILGILGLAQLNDFTDILFEDLFFILFIPFAFENPCLHFTPYKNQEFVLSLSLMKFRYNYDPLSEYEDSIFASGSLSLRYSVFHRSQWQWSVFAEAMMLYLHDHPTGFQFGVSLRHVSRRPVR